MEELTHDVAFPGQDRDGFAGASQGDDGLHKCGWKRWRGCSLHLCQVTKVVQADRQDQIGAGDWCEKIGLTEDDKST